MPANITNPTTANLTSPTNNTTNPNPPVINILLFKINNTANSENPCEPGFFVYE